MLLAIDARNHRVTLGLRGESGWRSVMRVGAGQERTPDEYALFMRAAAAEASLPAAPLAGGRAGESRVDAAWISSVVPALTPKLAQAVAAAFGLEATAIGPGVRTGVKIRTDVPSEVGSDLVCAAAAAHDLVRGASIVVDFGTALTFSAVNEAGDFMGAAIAPGIAAAAEALRANAAQIPDVRLETPPRAIGRSTAQSVQSGILLGYGGLVCRLIDLMRAELGAQVEVVGSGDAIGREVLQSCGFSRFVPDLVLEGIAIIASRR